MGSLLPRPAVIQAASLLRKRGVTFTEIRKEGEGFENAEERRLFYVALTRARHQVYFLYNEGTPSKFLTELMGANELSGEDLKVCPECGGRMVIRSGQFSQFYGCSNYPACKTILKI